MPITAINNSEIDNTIQRQIIQPLEYFFNGRETSVNWTMVNSSVSCFCLLPDEEMKVHKGLHNLYWEYLTGNHLLSGKDKSDLTAFLFKMLNRYDGLGEWIGGMDIMEMVDELLRRKEQPLHRFFLNMNVFLQQGYAPHIAKWNIKRIEEEIEELSVQNNPYRGEIFCMMQAYHSIAVCETISDDERMQMYELLRENWRYLVHVYSVMIGRIVGSGFTKFTQLVNNVNMMRDCHPYLHLFYNAVLLKENEIFPTEKDKDKAVKNITKMEDIMKETPREDSLDNLCKVLFGKEFEEFMARKKLPSYDELKHQVREYRDTINAMEQNWKVVVNKLKTAVESSVPISKIEYELMRLPLNMALGIFNDLNMLLVGDKTWNKNAEEIKDKLLQKANEIQVAAANIQVASVNKFENSGTYNDIDKAYILPNISADKVLPISNS